MISSHGQTYSFADFTITVETQTRDTQDARGVTTRQQVVDRRFTTDCGIEFVFERNMAAACWVVVARKFNATIGKYIQFKRRVDTLEYGSEAEALIEAAEPLVRLIRKQEHSIETGTPFQEGDVPHDPLIDGAIAEQKRRREEAEAEILESNPHYGSF